MTLRRRLISINLLALILAACSSEDAAEPNGTSGTTDDSTQSAANSSSSTVGTTGATSTVTSGTMGTTGTTGTMTNGTVGTTGLGSTTGTTGAGGQSSTGTEGGTTGVGGSTTGDSTGTTGMAGSGGSSGAGATSSTGSSGSGGTGGALPLGNPAVPSAGCGTATTVTTGKKTITSTGQERTYIIDIPDGYDMNKPYRLFYTSHWIGSTSEAVRDQDYYFLKPLATAANEPAIFVAPQSDGSTWQEKDHALFDDILAFVKENLCIDTTRVFATGFSFGGMITYSLSVNHQKDIRAAVGIAPANYNIYVPPKTHEPIAWMQTTGMSDGTCPWVNGNSSTQGAKYIALEHATDNGCTVPSDIPTWQSGGHICYDFEGCPTAYPVKACTFAGGHTNIDSDPGNNQNWIAQESWDFFMQF